MSSFSGRFALDESGQLFDVFTGDSLPSAVNASGAGGACLIEDTGHVWMIVCASAGFICNTSFCNSFGPFPSAIPTQLAFDGR